MGKLFLESNETILYNFMRYKMFKTNSHYLLNASVQTLNIVINYEAFTTVL